MSWLSAVTGKAEDFLNKLDKSAAEALHSEEASRKPQVSVPLTSDHFYQSPSQSHSYKSISPSASVPARLYNTSDIGQPKTALTPKTSLKSSSAAPSKVVSEPASSVTTVSKKVSVKQSTPENDEALFQFLNSPEPSDVNKKRASSIGKNQHSRQSSLSSRRDSGKSSTALAQQTESLSGWNNKGWTVGDDTVAAQQPLTEPDETKSTDDLRNSPTNSHESADLDALADAMKESPAASVSSGPDTDGQDNGDAHLSALELENGLLKNEVASLNQEISSLINHAKKSQTELVKTKEKLAQFTDSASLHDQLVQELQAREMDLHEALKAKDSQLAVLRVRLEDADRKACSRQRELDTLHNEHDRMLLDDNSSSGLHSQAVETLQQRLIDMEALLTREKQILKDVEQEAAERQSRLEEEEKSLADALTAAEKKITEERAKGVEALGQLKTLKATLTSTQQEMMEYKEKACRILQSKERLISSLRDGSGASGSVDGVSSLEYESVQQERDMLREELHKSKITTDSLRLELQDLDIQLQQEVGLAQDNIKSLEERLAEEKRHRKEVEEELLRQKKDLQYTTDDLQKQKANFQTRITDREREIEKLRNQLTTKSMSSTPESELESRVRSLTESLIQKQTMLEALSTEKNSLTLQLERMEKQYHDAENSLMRSAIASNRAGDHDDMRQRLPTFMREGVADTEVTRKVKHYVNSIDKFSMRIGVFLRRYPAARVFVLAYMILLHLWVMVVLATYQQEMHDKGP